jgi:tetratricopeptide (TPR) repeat protein
MKRIFARHLATFGVIFALALAAVPPCAAADDDVPEAADETSADVTETIETSAAGDPPSVALPPQELSEEILFHLLVGEIAAARKQFTLSAQTYIDLARQTRDPRLARRATEIAFAAHDLELARAATQIWSETDPQSQDARRLLDSVLRGNLTPLDGVETQIARALAQRPDKLGANLLGLAHTLAWVENKVAAMELVFHLTTPYLNHPEAYFARAQAAAIANRGNEALAAIDLALAARPDWEPALLLKAQLLINAGAAADASKLVENVLARHPDSRTLKLAYARSLAAGQQFEAALSAFRAVLDDTPDDGEALYAVALLTLDQGKPAEAEPLLLKALEGGHPQADAIRIQLGQIAANRGDHAAARKWFAAVSTGRYALEARVRSARSLAQEGQLKEARHLLHQQADTPEDRQRLILADAQLLTEAGQGQEAYALVDAALATAPDNADLLYETSMLAERIGLFEVMEGRLRKLIALHPDHAHALNALGYSLADRGLRLEEAEELITRALEITPKDAFILDSKGWVKFKRGDLEGARAALEEAYAIRTDAEIAAHLGEVLWLLKLNDDARRVLDTAAATHPDNTVLQETIRRLYQP